MYPAASIDVDMSFGWMSRLAAVTAVRGERRKKQKDLTGCCSQKRHPGIEKEERKDTRFHAWGNSLKQDFMLDVQARF